MNGQARVVVGGFSKRAQPASRGVAARVCFGPWRPTRSPGALTAGIQATLARGWSSLRAKPATRSRRSSWTGGRFETTGLVGSVEFNALGAGSSFDLIIVQTAAWRD
jgi:hypothetical protein